MNLLPKFKEYLFSQSSPSSKTTVKNYISDVSRFIRWFEAKFGAFSPALISPQIIEQFKQSNNGAVSSLERNLSSLRKFFNFLKLEGQLEHSPFELETASREASAKSDPYRLKAFKDYLYVYNASKLTIKNYLMDIRGFIKWLEAVTKVQNAWDLKDTALLSRIDSHIIEEYKRRLSYSPRTINRKLSSLRKYLKWAESEGLIHSEHLTTLQDDARLSNITIKTNVRSLSQIRQQSSNQNKNTSATTLSSPASDQLLFTYSSFPPLRLVQKSFRAIIFIPEFILVNPLSSIVKTAEDWMWRIQGKPVFERLKERSASKIRIKSLPKEAFAPFAISISQLPLHKKIAFHLAHTRPEWYKKYHQYSFSHYFHLAILMVFMSAIGFGIYQNISPKQSQGVLGFANPQAPPRILSFQGRLTDSSDNPITSSTDLRFALYDSPTGTGSALLWQEVNTVTPDSDGIFSLLLGNKSTMSQSLFAERAGLWLGVSVGQTAELTPRQRLATVAYAENADNLQGLPPITQSGAGQTNVVLALDSSGNLTIGGTATPTFQATGGRFSLSGNPLLLTTSGTSESNVEINPGGRSFIDLQKPLQNSTNNNNVSTALGAVEVDDLFAILATSSGQSALTINQNDTGPLLSASTSGTAKFTVANSGATTIADDLAVNGGDVTSTQTTFNLLNSTVTTLNIGGAATTINLGATSGTTTTANSLTILGNTTLGDTAADTITFTGSIASNVVPDANNTRNLGSSSLRWNTVYGTTGDFTNIAGTVTGGSTTSSSWTINSDNSTANAEVSSLAFETGTAAFNAALQWNASGDAGRVTGFDNTNLFNFPIGIYSQVSGGNQTFTSGTLFKYGQPAVHAITQSAAFIGTDYDFSSNITVPNSASGNQTGFKATLKDGGASATAIGFQTAGTLDYGIDLGGTIGTAEIRLSNAETIDNLTNGKVNVTATNLDLTGTAYQINGASGSTVSACGASQYLGGVAVTGGIVTALGTCQTVSTAWNSLSDPTGSLSLAMGANTTTFTWNAATGASTNLFNLADTTNNTGTGYLLSLATASGSNALPLRVSARGNNIIDTTAAGGVTIGNATAAQAVTVDAGTGTLNVGNSNSAKTINIGTGTAADTINIGTGGTTGDTINIGGIAGTTINIVGGTVNVTGNIVGTGTVTGTQLISTVATGTAPLSVTSTTVVPNLNVSQLQGYGASDLYSQPQPNLVLNSDFGRRNKWMTFMPEVFSDTSGWTAIDGSIGSVASNQLTPTPNAGNFEARAGLSTWLDVRVSALFQVKGNAVNDTLVSGIWVNSTNWLRAQLDVNIGRLYITENVGGSSLNIASQAGADSGQLTNDKFYWVELERQGTKIIAKWYTCPAAASACAKSAATLTYTLSATTSLAATNGGYAYLRTYNAGTTHKIGGLSTGDGGVYVEGWGPESWTITHSGTLGGQAIGFDETANAGPLGKQWAVQSYIPAASRGIRLFQGNAGENPIAISRMSPSTAYAASVYEKISGRGGTGSLFFLKVRTLTNTSSVVTETAADMSDSNDADWTRLTTGGTFTSGSTVKDMQFAIGINYNNATGAVASATGTAYFLLPQLEQGSVATPWRNAPADDGPIVWRLAQDVDSNKGNNGNRGTITTSSTSAVEIESSLWAANIFLPWDAGTTLNILGTWTSNTANALNISKISVDGTDQPQFAQIQNASANQEMPMLYQRARSLAAGKHRIAGKWFVGSGTATLYDSTAGVQGGGLIITATRGKFDLAEEYTVLDQTIEAGDVVQLTSDNSQTASTIEKSIGGYNQSVLGIISTDPGITLASTVELNGYREKPNLRPVALSGRVPVKTTTENGPIYRGDTLTSSATKPGYAMKAIKAGKSIGIAMEDLYNGEGKIMTFVNLSWYDPDVYLADTGGLIIQKVQNTQVAQVSDIQSEQTCEQTTDSSNFGLISECPKTDLVSQVENQTEQYVLDNVASYAYKVVNATGNAVDRVGVFSNAFVATLKAGVVETKDLIAENITVQNEIISPLAEVSTVRTDTISPLSSNKVVVKLETSDKIQATSSGTPTFEIQNASGSAVAVIDDTGNASFSGQLSSQGLNTEEATISGTLRTKNLIAENIESSILNLKSSILNLSEQSASESAIDIASYSAELANVDTLQAQVGTFMNGLFAVGPTSLSDATVFGQLSVGGNLILADNSINVLGSDLQIQPLAQGGISFLAGKVIIDSSGNLTVNGDAKFNGTLFANVISPIPGQDLVFKLLDKSATDSGQFKIVNASGSAVASIDNEGNALFNKLNLNVISPALALSEHEFIATGSAGVATISAQLKEVTILNKLVTDKSLIYITPVGTASATPFLLRQEPNESFTVGVQTEQIDPTVFNWLIIN